MTTKFEDMEYPVIEFDRLQSAEIGTHSTENSTKITEVNPIGCSDQQREISVVDETIAQSRIVDILSDKDNWASGEFATIKYFTTARAIYEYFRPHLRTTEPVSLTQIICKMPDDVRDHTYTEIIKIVLDAAGVKYNG